MSKFPTRKAPATVATRPDVLTTVPAPAPRLTSRGRVAPIVRDTIVDMKPKTDPRTGKPEVPGMPTSKARQQTPDNPQMRVQATRQVYYQHKRRREGDVFTLAKLGDFNAKCHQWVHADTPERLTTSRETIQRQHAEVMAQRAAKAHDPSTPGDAARTDDDDVLS